MPSAMGWSWRHGACMNVLLLIGFWCNGTANSQLPVPRRDLEYPPPAAIAFLTPLSTQCVAETGVSPSAIKRFSDKDVFEDDHKLKCYMNCLFQKSNVTDANGELHLGKLLDQVVPEFEDIMLQMGVKCTKPKGKDLCERAFWYHKCWKKSDPVHYYLV